MNIPVYSAVVDITNTRHLCRTDFVPLLAEKRLGPLCSGTLCTSLCLPLIISLLKVSFVHLFLYVFCTAGCYKKLIMKPWPQELHCLAGHRREPSQDPLVM
uniref:Uncharacterized protein n=1 Tax=Pyxicephalus adspersus TaxID=30357 RepID=A0AAV2ZV98_PYXAD|nr:TPA: hypothetical protein GDO54_016229 [Pyxicephalus adspersus]